MSTARPSPRRRAVAAAVALALLTSACAANEDDAQVAVDNGSTQAEETSASSEATEAESQTDSVATEAEATQPGATESQSQDPYFFGEFASLDGASVDLADLAGQDVVLWFWAPW